jgi:hypothetical protein
MIGSLMMCVSVVILLVGMLAGVAMGMQEDFALQPAHAHLNLVGGVLLFLFGLYYRLIPAAGGSRDRQNPGLAAHRRRHPVSDRRCHCDPERPLVNRAADRGVADRGGGDGAVCVYRVPDGMGLRVSWRPVGTVARPNPAVTFCVQGPSLQTLKWAQLRAS